MNDNTLLSQNGDYLSTGHTWKQLDITLTMRHL